MPSFCGVILAAGESSRMGRDKALLPWPPGAGSSTFLSTTIELLQARSELVTVVAGKNADSLRPIVYAAAAYLVINRHSDAFSDAYENEKWAVVPEHGGRHGHPIVIGREMIEAFLRAPATSTARDVEHSLQQRVLYVPVDDANVVANVDTPEEYGRLANTRVQ